MSIASSVDIKALDILVKSPVSQEMIYKIVVSTLQILPCPETKTFKGSGTDSREKQLPSLMTFLTRLVRYTNVYTGTLLATLVYLNRLKSRLPKDAHGMPCTRHRILLSCLILSSKFHNDSSPKNKHWARYTDGLFSTKDINLMERQLIYLLNWDLRVSNAEMIGQLKKFLLPIAEDLVNSERMRRYLKEQKEHIEHQLQRMPSGAKSPSPHLSRSSSNSSTLSLHYRQKSVSSMSSESSSEPSPEIKSLKQAKIFNSDYVNPMIELAALKEEKELSDFLTQLNNFTHN